MMKKVLYTLAFIAVFILNSCKTNQVKNTQTINLGIYVSENPVELPDTVVRLFRKLTVEAENDTASPFIGYIDAANNLNPVFESPDSSYKILRTLNTVDKNGKYHGMVVVKTTPFIGNDDISKTKAEGNKLIIYFNPEGSGKWADITRNFQGKTVAFTIDNVIYSLPLINGTVTNGVAMIGALDSEATALKLSDALNGN